MTTNPTHTPTPWHTEAVNTQVGHCWKIEPIGACIYVDNQRLPHEAENKPSQEAKANAAFIVRAVNAHEELLDSLMKMVEAFDVMANHIPKGLQVDMPTALLVETARVNADKAIAKAEGKP